MEKIIEKLEEMVEGMSMKGTLGSALAIAFVSGFCIKLFTFAKDCKFGQLFVVSIILLLILIPLLIVSFPCVVGYFVGTFLIKHNLKWFGIPLVVISGIVNIFFFFHIF